jgi:superfamily II DNA or RNA helicase
MIQLWPFQGSMVDRVREAIRRGHKKILIQAPTGSGKTVIGSHMIHGAEQKGNPVLFFAHRRQLVDQAADKLDRFGVRNGTIMRGEERDVFAGVQIASVDTFRSWVMNKMRVEWPDAKLLFVDEAHRSLSPTYLEIINRYVERGTIVIGLTATPIRGDGRGLGNVYDVLIHGPQIHELVRDGYLAPPIQFAPSIPDLTGVRTTAGDWNAADLDRALNQKHLIGDVVENWMRYARGRPTIAFATSVAHSMGLADEFLRCGVNAVHIDAETSDFDREKVEKDMESGRISVVTNCMVLTEGVDWPFLSCCIIDRPTKNRGLYLQMAGRVMRIAPGKTDTMILDHSGCTYRHGRVMLPYTWTLDTKRFSDKDAKKAAKARSKKEFTCPNCACVFGGSDKCPHCGYVMRKFGQHIVNKDGVLVMIDEDGREVPAKYTIEEYQHWLDMFEEKRYDRPNREPFSDRWRNERFMEKFGFWPPEELQGQCQRRPLNGECRAWFQHLQIKWAKRNKQRDSVAPEPA